MSGRDARRRGVRLVMRATLLLSLHATMLAAQRPGAPVATGPRTLSLEEALRIAEPASEQLLLSQAGVTRADGDFYRARSNFLPQLNGFGQYQRTIKSQYNALFGSSATTTTTPSLQCGTFAANPTLPLEQRVDSLEKGLLCANAGQGGSLSDLPFGRPNIWNVGLTASLTLFNGQYLGQQRAANAERVAAKAELTSQRAQVILDVVRSYYDATLADRQLAIAESTLAQAERTLADVEIQRKVGKQSEYERLRAAVTRDNQKPTVIQRRTQRVLARVRLAQLLDLPTADSLTLTTSLGDTTNVPLPPFAQEIVSANDTTVESRLPVQKAVATLQQQEGNFSSAKFQRAPTLTLSSTYQKIAYPTGALPPLNSFLSDWNVVVRMDVPLFTGGRLRGAALLARATRDEASARVALAREQAARELADAQSTLAGTYAQWTAVQGTVEQAQKAYDIAEVRFREGLSTQTELNDSRVQLQQAEGNRAQAAHDLQVARVKAGLLHDLPFDVTAAGTATTTGTTTTGTTGTTTTTTTGTTGTTSTPTGSTGTTTTGSTPR